MEREIVRAAVHPAIGVARVGNSPVLRDGTSYEPRVPKDVELAA